MTPFQPSSHLLDGGHAVRFADGIALLDVAADAYSCFYDPVAHATAVFLSDTRSIEPDAARGRRDEHPSGRWRDLPPADAEVRPRDLLRFVSALALATIRFRSSNFSGLLATRAGRPPIPEPLSPEELAAVLARFDRMALFLPVRFLCLFRSFFLLHFLRRYGYTADWVFGVTLFPFRAHCWLASGDLLLGETVGRAKRFSPILVVQAWHK